MPCRLLQEQGLGRGGRGSGRMVAIGKLVFRLARKNEAARAADAAAWVRSAAVMITIR
jgi:hypothetical protein